MQNLLAINAVHTRPLGRYDAGSSVPCEQLTEMQLERVPAGASQFNGLGKLVQSSIRVDEPMLSMVVTRRRAYKRSGASVPSARQAPLNSSFVAVSLRISGEIWMESGRVMETNATTSNTRYERRTSFPGTYPYLDEFCQQFSLSTCFSLCSRSNLARNHRLQ